MNRSTIVSGDAITQVNSTTYTDVAGLYAGLDRFPGETSDQFMRRVQQASALNQGANYEGLLNQLNLLFGLSPAEIFQVSSPGTVFSFSVSVKGVVLSSGQESLSVPTWTVDSDNFWKWRLISEVVGDINKSRTFKATLLEDGPAIQMVKQANTAQVRTADVVGTTFVFNEEFVDQNSILFNVAVPNWIFSDNRSLLFDHPVPDNTVMTYRYFSCPYTVVGYPAAALSLTDPGLKDIAVTSKGQMIYQIREYLYAVALQDRSYWGN